MVFNMATLNALQFFKLVSICLWIGKGVSAHHKLLTNHHKYFSILPFFHGLGNSFGTGIETNFKVK